MDLHFFLVKNTIICKIDLLFFPYLYISWIGRRCRAKILLKETAMNATAMVILLPFLKKTIKIKDQYQETKITAAVAAQNIRERRERMLIRKKADHHEIKKLFRRFVSLDC